VAAILGALDGVARDRNLLRQAQECGHHGLGFRFLDTFEEVGAEHRLSATQFHDVTA